VFTAHLSLKNVPPLPPFHLPPHLKQVFLFPYSHNHKGVLRTDGKMALPSPPAPLIPAPLPPAVRGSPLWHGIALDLCFVSPQTATFFLEDLSTAFYTVGFVGLVLCPFFVAFPPPSPRYLSCHRSGTSGRPSYDVGLTSTPHLTPPPTLRPQQLLFRIVEEPPASRQSPNPQSPRLLIGPGQEVVFPLFSPKPPQTFFPSCLFFH